MTPTAPPKGNLSDAPARHDHCCVVCHRYSPHRRATGDEVRWYCTAHLPEGDALPGPASPPLGPQFIDRPSSASASSAAARTQIAAAAKSVCPGLPSKAGSARRRLTFARIAAEVSVLAIRSCRLEWRASVISGCTAARAGRRGEQGPARWRRGVSMRRYFKATATRTCKLGFVVLTAT
jgi:hypothetical protein